MSPGIDATLWHSQADGVPVMENNRLGKLVGWLVFILMTMLSAYFLWGVFCYPHNFD
jgi:hypothetical protein